MNYLACVKSMKLTILILMITVWQVNAKGYSQNISLHLKNVPFGTALSTISRVSGFRVVYEKGDIARAGKVNVNLNDVSLEEALSLVFRDQPLNYTINGKFIVVQPKTEPPSAERTEVLPPGGKLSGTVLGKDGEALEAATVTLKSVEGAFQKAVETDAKGKFVLADLPAGNYTLTITSIGYGRYEKTVTVGEAPQDLNVVMNRMASDLSDMVVVGYGTQKKVSMTSAVTTISSEQIQNRAVPSVTNILEGLAGGLAIQQTAAQPGYSQNSINIRGTSTLSNNPVLFIVDGMAVNSLDYLNPSDIASVSVLKDVSATAIYGARAAGGVILVTTKKGHQNQAPKLEYDAMVGVQRPARLPKFVGAPGYVDLYNQAQLNDNPNGVVEFTPQLAEQYKSGALPSTNWVEYLLSNRAIQQQHTLSVTGGTNNMDYYISGGYLDQGGLVKTSDYKRYSARANINVQVSKRFKIGLNALLTKETKSQPAFGVNTPLSYAFIVPVTEYPFTKAGLPRAFNGGAGPNSVIQLGGSQVENDYTINTNFLAEFKILDNLVLTGTYGYNYSTLYNTSYYAKNPLYNDAEQIVTYTNSNATLYKNNTQNIDPTSQLMLNYHTDLGKHAIKALAGYSSEEFYSEGNQLSRSGFLNNNVTQINGGSSDPTQQGTYGSATDWAIRSFFGRLNYAFDNKYLLEVNARYDGSSIFLDKKWGFFPSVSAGWIVSEEKFFSGMSRVFNYLKLRGSYGQVGNQNAVNGNYYPGVNTVGQGSYVLNNTVTTTTYYSNSPNADLTWEVKTTGNIGLDMSFLDRRLDVTLDGFREITTGVLRQPNVPLTFGASSPVINGGKVLNRGYEITINYKDHIGKLSYHVGLNLADSRNKILNLGGTGNQIGNNPLIVGQGVWEWYGLKTNGYFQSAQDVASSPFQNSKNIAGDVKYQDINKDGQITPDDRVLLGQAVAHYQYGIPMGASYKGWDIQLLLQGVLSNLTALTGGAQMPFQNGIGNVLTSQLDYWSPTNRNPRYPILRIDQSVNNSQLSNEWLWKSAYMRFKNVQLGYTLNADQLRRLKISSVRIFAAADNLFVVTSKYFPKVLDPEIGNNSSGQNYPQVRNVSLGLNVAF